MTSRESLEQRIDQLVAGWGLVITKKKVFRSMSYFINGNMAFGVHGEDVLLRMSEEEGNRLLQQPGFRRFSMGSRQSAKNWYFASPEVTADYMRLRVLLEVCRDFVLTLPAK